MGIFESEIASSAQVKGAEIVVASFRGSKMETDNDLERVVVGIRDLDSVCVDMVAEEDGGMI